MIRPLLFLGLAACLLPSAARAAKDGGSRITDAIVAKVDPSVVSIQHERGAGSGFIVSEDGYILSNGHVVMGSDPEDPTRTAESITVILNDERKLPARVIGFCLDPDVALLQIEAGRPLHPVEFADSTRVQVGQPCFAVGTPLGLKRTFTGGILSNVERADLFTFTKVFQTDAALNPGNSGGALFDQHGRVLGINTYGRDGANNLGFTIPIHVARVLKDHFLQSGRFVRADLPVVSIDELYDELAETLGVEPGALVSFAMPGTLAWEAGLRDGDVLVEIDGQPVSARTRCEMLDLNWKLTTNAPGTPIRLTLLRGAPGETERVTIDTQLVESEPFPRMGRHLGELLEHRYDSLGFGYQRLTVWHRLMYRLSDAPGVWVASVAKLGPAEKADLQFSDIITHVAGVPTPDLATFQAELEKHLATQEKAIELTLMRANIRLPTALAPNYDLKGCAVALVAPDGGSEHLPLLRRELLAEGAQVRLVTPSGGDVPLGEGRTAAAASLGNFGAEGIRILLVAGNGKDQTFWSNPHVLALAQAVYEREGILAGVGSASLALVTGVPDLHGKKMTLPKEYSAEALARGANYTGAEVEIDGRLVTSTGFDRANVRSFLKALRRTARNQR